MSSSSARKPEISFADFDRVDIRAGTIIEAEPFPEARERAMRYSWKACAEMFMDTVEEALGTKRKLAA